MKIDEFIIENGQMNNVGEEPVSIVMSENDLANRDKLLAIIDDGFLEWTQNKSREYIRMMTYYKCAMLEIETKFNVLNEEFSLRFDRNPINSIKTRLKSLQSIKQKIDRKGLPVSLETIESNIYDVAGIRVICSFPEDVYMLADALLNQDDIELISRKDYIESPKPNGYRSLHLIVSVPIFLAHEKRIMKVEIQLRTIAMDFWATLEHQLRYKKDVIFSDAAADELKRCAEISAMLDRRMDMLRKKILEE